LKSNFPKESWFYTTRNIFLDKGYGYPIIREQVARGCVLHLRSLGKEKEEQAAIPDTGLDSGRTDLFLEEPVSPHANSWIKKVKNYEAVLYFIYFWIYYCSDSALSLISRLVQKRNGFVENRHAG